MYALYLLGDSLEEVPDEVIVVPCLNVFSQNMKIPVRSRVSNDTNVFRLNVAPDLNSVEIPIRTAGAQEYDYFGHRKAISGEKVLIGVREAGG